MINSPIILALDTNDLDIAKMWVNETAGSIALYKLGLEFYLKFGRSGLKAIQSETDSEIFLDLKLHDIPNTVGSATAQVADLHPRFLTVHASGGSEMIKAAVSSAPNTDITAVTILTSLSHSDLREIGFEGEAEERVAALSKMAVNSGAKAIVCSPLEIEIVRSVVPSQISIITPGIRPKFLQNSNAEGMKDDQKRVLDPKSAIKSGANYLVIGRPITAAENIRDVARAILDEVLS